MSNKRRLDRIAEALAELDVRAAVRANTDARELLAQRLDAMAQRLETVGRGRELSDGGGLSLAERFLLGDPTVDLKACARRAAERWHENKTTKEQ